MRVCWQTSSLKPLEDGHKLVVLSLQLGNIILRHIFDPGTGSGCQDSASVQCKVTFPLSVMNLEVQLLNAHGPPG